MKRRVALAAVASGFGVTAGCMGLLPSRPEGGLGGGGGGEEPTTTSASTTGGETTESPSGGGTPTNEERTGGGGNETGSGSSATLESCPTSLVENVDVDKIVCDGKQTTDEVFLYTEDGTVSLPSGSIDFTLRNTIPRGQFYSPCQWTVYREANGSWKPVKPLKRDSVEKNKYGAFVTLTLYVGQEPPTDVGKCRPYSLDNPSPGRYLFGIVASVGKPLLAVASFRVTE